MQRATDSLEHEHRTIEKIVRVTGVLVDELAENRDIDDRHSSGSLPVSPGLRPPMSSRQGREVICSQCLNAMAYPRKVVLWARCGTNTSGHES